MTSAIDRPKISDQPISLFLPAHNQATALAAVAESWLRALDKLDREYELLLVDDGSSDGTTAVIDGLAGRHPRLVRLKHDTPRGFGASLRTALAASGFPLFAYVTLDYPYAPTDLAKLLAAIDAVDVVNACRTDPPPGWMQSLGRAWRLIVRVILGISLAPRPGWLGWPEWRRAMRLRWVYGLRFHDPTSGFKLFRKTIFDRLPIQSDGEFARAEMLAKANFMGCLMDEVAVGRLGGSFKGVGELDGRYDAESRRVFRKPEFGPLTIPAPSASAGN